MDEEIERLVIGVRADPSGFMRDVEAMRAVLEGPLAAGANRAGRMVESALLRAVRTGKLGFDDLRAVALGVLEEIASAAIRGGLNSLLGGGVDTPSVGGTILSLLGAPGRATGGPVSPARPYWVGERGPELFVPTSAGQVMANGGGLGVANGGSGGGRDVRVAITIQAGTQDAPAVLARSGRQVARAVRAALMEAQ
ncbi:tail tape measure protein [Sphingomonas sp.]|uniref:tail tape measure protein n=1 Tax=Sphingomonas sp. TaxID=28214 RepID=UPI0035C83633